MTLIILHAKICIIDDLYIFRLIFTHDSIYHQGTNMILT